MKELSILLSRIILFRLSGLMPVPPANNKQGPKAVSCHIPGAHKAARDEGLVKLVTYGEQEAEQQHYNQGNCPVGVMGKGLQTIEKCPGQGAIGNNVQELIDAKKLGELDKISRLVGQIKNHPHDGCHGDESQINLHISIQSG